MSIILGMSSDGRHVNDITVASQTVIQVAVDIEVELETVTHEVELETPEVAVALETTTIEVELETLNT